MEAFERKVRPIYDALDARNWKGAIKLANSALQKHKGNPLIKALKAVALERAGKTDEAFQVCEEVRACGPTDDHILHMMSIVYKSTGSLHCLTEAFAEACKKQPNNMELLQGLFGCYVREGEYAKQQQVAMKIYKQQSSDDHLHWVVLSLVLQAWGQTTGLKAPMGIEQTLKLAESMIVRQIKQAEKNNSAQLLGSKEALLLYLDILHAQGKVDEALECLQGRLGDLCPLETEKFQLEAQCYIRKGMWEEAAEKLKKVLAKIPDDWQVLEMYFDCMLPSTAKRFAVKDGWLEVHYESCQLTRHLKGIWAACQTGEVSNSGQDRLEDAEKMLQMVVGALINGSTTKLVLEDSKDENTQGNGESVECVKASTSTSTSETKGAPDANAKRCALLAQTELAFRKVKLDCVDESHLVEMICTAYREIGHLGSWSLDVKDYVVSLGPELRSELAEELNRHSKVASTSSSDFNSIKRRVTLKQVCCDMEFPGLNTAPDFQSFAESCLKNFTDSKPLLKNLDERELGPADNGISVATNAMMHAHSKFPQNGVNFWQGVVISAHGATHRPYNPRINLDLCALYGLLGCPELAYEHMQRLEVKYIQLDSLASHFLLPVLLGHGRDKETRQLLVETLQLFEEHGKDAGETILTAYKRGTLTKVLEFIDFKDCLDFSHTYHVALAEESIFRIKEGIHDALPKLSPIIQDACTALPTTSVQSISLDRFRFNEDLDSRPSWFPPIFGVCHLGVREWWETWGSCREAAVEWTSPDYMEKRKKEVKRRWLLPHMLQALWLMNQKGSDIEVLESVIKSEENGADVCGGLKTKLEAFKSSPTSKLLGLYNGLQDLVWSMACIIPDVWHHSSEGASEAGEKLLEIADLVSQYLTVIVDCVCGEIASKGGQLGGTVVIVNALLKEEMAWLGVALQAWQKKAGSKKKKSSANSDRPKLPAPFPDLSKSLHSTLLTNLSKLKQSIDTVIALDKEETLKSLIDLIGGESGPDSSSFSVWNLCGGSDVRKVLAKVLDSQTECWRRVGEIAGDWNVLDGLNV